MGAVPALDVYHTCPLVFVAVLCLPATLPPMTWLLGTFSVGTLLSTDIRHIRLRLFAAELRPPGAFQAEVGAGGRLAIIVQNCIHRLLRGLPPRPTRVGWSTSPPDPARRTLASGPK